MPSDLLFLSTYNVSPECIVLIVFLIVAVVTDIRERRIPNWLVATGIVFGTAFHGLVSNRTDAAFALLGLVAGVALLIPFYLIRAMGAGDVKLMGMIGSFLGASGVYGTALATMAAGGLLAIGMTASMRMLPQLFANLRTMLIQRHIQQMSGSFSSEMPALPSVGKMPYAIPIFAGTVIQLFFLRY